MGICDRVSDRRRSCMTLAQVTGVAGSDSKSVAARFATVGYQIRTTIGGSLAADAGRVALTAITRNGPEVAVGARAITKCRKAAKIRGSDGTKSRPPIPIPVANAMRVNVRVGRPERYCTTLIT